LGTHQEGLRRGVQPYHLRTPGVRPNPSLKRGPPPAWRLAREAPAVYHAPRGPGTAPLRAA
jgi:hypothetical protein